MNARHELLARASLLGTAWLSIKIVVQHFGTLLAILAIVCLPLDIMIDAADGGLDVFMTRHDMPEQMRFGFSMIFLSFAGLTVGAVLALVVGQLIEGDTPTLRSTLGKIVGRRLVHVFGTLLYTTVLTVLPLLVFLAALLLVGGWLHEVSELLVIGCFFLAVVIVLFLALNYVFSVYVAVFEGTYYHAALRRSTTLVRGRRWWLAMVLFAAWIPFVIMVVAIVSLPDLFNAPESGLDSAAGLIRFAGESIGANIVLAWFSSFQVLLYLRRRREQHDLTFFDLSRIDVMHPAADLLEPSP